MYRCTSVKIQTLLAEDVCLMLLVVVVLGGRCWWMLLVDIVWLILAENVWLMLLVAVVGCCSPHFCVGFLFFLLGAGA